MIIKLVTNTIDSSNKIIPIGTTNINTALYST